MICNIALPLSTKKIPNVSENVLLRIKEFPESLRKILRLIAKQYQITSIIEDPIIEEISFTHRIIRDNIYIVTYNDEFGGMFELRLK